MYITLKSDTRLAPLSRGASQQGILWFHIQERSWRIMEKKKKTTMKYFKDIKQALLLREKDSYPLSFLQYEIIIFHWVVGEFYS